MVTRSAGQHAFKPDRSPERQIDSPNTQLTSRLISRDDHVLWDLDRGDIDQYARANGDARETTKPTRLR